MSDLQELLPGVAQDSRLRPDHGGDKFWDEDVGDAAPPHGEENDEDDEEHEGDPVVLADLFGWHHQL